MEVEISMIRIHYNHKKKPINRTLPIRDVNNGDIILENDKNEYVIPNHYQSQNDEKIRQVGIRFLNNSNEVQAVKLTPLDEGPEVDFEYHDDESIWYQRTLFSSKKIKKRFYEFDKNSLLIGMTNAGSVLLKYKVNGEFKTAATLHFEPDVFPMDDFKEMVADLYNIREELVRDDLNIAKVAITTKSVMQDFEKQLKDLSFAVHQINSNPHSRLQHKIKNISSLSQGEYNLRRKIDEYINPGKPYYRTAILESVDTTFENKLIKQLLIELVNYAEEMGSKRNLVKAKSRNLYNERKMYLDKIDPAIRKQFENIEDVLKNEHYQEIYKNLKKQEEEIINKEIQLREEIKKNANFSLEPKEHRGCHLELNLKIKGTLTSNNEYAHSQSNGGITAKLKYNNLEPQLKVIDYTIYVRNIGKNFSPNSHFGDIELNTKNIISHWLMHKAIGGERQADVQTEERLISICGFVKRQNQNPVDPILVQQKDDKYGKYKFVFTHINKIIINGKEIERPKEKNILEDFLKNELLVKAPFLDDLEDIRMKIKQLDKLRTLSTAIKNIKKIGRGFDKVKETAEELLELPLFKSLVIEERIPFRPSQVFLHNPPYRLAWHAIGQIHENLSASLINKQDQYLVSTKKVHDIFEIWILYKMIQLLTKELGWELSSGQDIITFIDTYLSTGKQSSMKNFKVKLGCNKWEIELSYEPTVNLESGNYLRPDFILKFIYESKVSGLVILDAKYRDYTVQKEGQWKKDINDTAINKYGRMKPIEDTWNYPIITSGIIHSDIKFSENNEETYNPYHVMYNEKLFETKLLKEEPHKYNSIYLIPSNTYVFKNWFRMIMEFHLESYKFCWSCGEQTNINEEKKVTKKGFLKFHYTCKNCEEFWVKVHCNNNKTHKLIKHINNYHLQVEKNKKWFVVCPTCGNGRGNIDLNRDSIDKEKLPLPLDSYNINLPNTKTDMQEAYRFINSSFGYK